MPVYVAAPANATPASLRANVELYYWYQTYAGTQNNYRVHFDDGAGGAAALCVIGNRNNQSFTLQAGNFEWSPEYNLWHTTVTATLRNRTGTNGCGGLASQAPSAKIDFRMRIQNFRYSTTTDPTVRTVTSNGARLPQGNSWISYAVPSTNDPNADSYFFSTDARTRGGGYASYTLYFATPCEFTGPATGTIRLYDLDNGHTDNGPNSNLNDRIQVTIRDRTVPGALGTVTRTGSMGNNGTYNLAMTFQPGHSYSITVSNIYYWNVLQYRLPYDNIAYVTGCGTVSGSLSPVLDVNPSRSSVANGDTFTAYFRADNTASAVVPAATEARIWYDRNLNGRFDSGEYVEWHNRTSSGSPDMADANTVSTLKQRNVTVDATRGSNICVSWQLISTTTPGVTVDDEVLVECMSINQTPFVQVWGNDLRVGGRYGGDTANTDNALIQTAVMQASSGRYYGSWAEYGVLAPGVVSGTASGSGLANGHTSNDMAQWSGLTFANSPDLDCPSDVGCFTESGANMGTLPDVAGAIDRGVFDGVPVTTSCDAITARTVASSRVIRCNGTLTISGDVVMAPGPYANERAIPQLIIVADNINILEHVRRVDAWLVANQTVNTCSNGPSSLTLSDCDQTLDINGPVMARTLVMRRTAGAGTLTAASYAERFNLRADTYIWAYSQAQLRNAMRTTYTRELAPRY